AQKSVSHAFANAAVGAVARTVRLAVTNHDDVASTPVSQTIMVQGTPAQQGPEQPPQQLIPDPPNVQPLPVVAGPGKARLGVAKVAAAGVLPLTIACATQPGPCVGSVKLAAKTTVKRTGKRSTKTVTIAKGSFNLTAGQKRVLSLRLAAAAR